MSLHRRDVRRNGLTVLDKDDAADPGRSQSLARRQGMNSGEIPSLDLTENSKVTVEIIVDSEPASAPIMHRFRFVCEDAARLDFVVPAAAKESASTAVKQSASTANRK